MLYIKYSVLQNDSFQAISYTNRAQIAINLFIILLFTPHMQLIQADFKKGLAQAKLTDLDDLWYLHQIIEPGDLITAVATRKVKIGESDNANVVKKVYRFTIAAETIEFGAAGNTLRINGKIKSGPEDVPKESYQAIALEEGSEVTIQKEKWLQYQQQKMKEATERKKQFLLCLLDREEALFALITGKGFQVLTSLKGDVPKKAKIVEIKKEFYQEISLLLESYYQRYHPERVIIASPAFYKDELLQKITSPELKQKSITVTCYDVSEQGINEVIKRPELEAVLKHSRSREEQLLVENLLTEIHKQGKAVYGWKEVWQALQHGAVQELLVSDSYIQKQKESGSFAALDQAMRQIDAQQGKIHILASDQEGGKKLNGIGGIAALLRYKI